jgi:hypothetical protein
MRHRDYRKAVMKCSPLPPDPELRASPLRAAWGLPFLVYRSLRWRALRGGWLTGHLRSGRPFDRRAIAPGTPIDVMVMVADHYEPARRDGDDAAVESVRTWCAEYEAIADRHRDSDGRPPQHTWFYRYDYPNAGCVQVLSECSFRGFGEVEFHLHHGHDSHESMAATLREGVEWFNRFGAMLTAEEMPRRTFGYVAGNSALDNGAGDDGLSGCDTEIRALCEAGCYADFTFSSLGSPAQPRTTNSIYYATEDGGPKSYDTGVGVEVGRPPSGDLMIFQGPTSFDWRYGRIDDGGVENSSPPHPRRLGAWLKANVHVPGRPEWVFVKLHTHAMQNRASFLSPLCDATFAAMGEWWTRPPFRLHYVTAREAYNIVKAAEAGFSGNPDDYRDFVLAPPANRLVQCTAPWRLRSWSPDRAHVDLLEPGAARLTFARGGVRSVAGRLREVEVRYRGDEVVSLRLEGDGPFEVRPPAGADGAQAAWGAPRTGPAGGCLRGPVVIGT